jgi:hypothetical protein
MNARWVNLKSCRSLLSLDQQISVGFFLSLFTSLLHEHSYPFSSTFSFSSLEFLTHDGNYFTAKSVVIHVSQFFEP